MQRASRKAASNDLRPAEEVDDDHNEKSAKVKKTHDRRRLALHCILILLVIATAVKTAPFLMTKFPKATNVRPKASPNILLRRKESKEPGYHIIFSTDCSGYQHWQSYLLYFSAMRVGQPGKVTRIASGCKDKEREELIEWHKKHVTPMSPLNEPNKYTLHLTPHFSAVKDDSGKVVDDYEFFNKPFGLLHWLENYDDSRDKYGISYSTDNDPKNTPSLKLDPDDIVILLDPDMVLLRPITQDFTPTKYYKPKFTSRKQSEVTMVSHGHPFGQDYGFGSSWAELNLTRITGSATSPALKVSNQDAHMKYAVGPPYVATASDMYKIAQKWAEFVPRTYKEYPYLLAEMYAYCIAAADLQLPHVNVASLMVSGHTISDTEGWDFLEGIPSEDICRFGAFVIVKAFEKSREENLMADKGFSNAVAKFPHVLHICQRYMVGEWFFGKRKLPHDYFSCESPILVTPPDNLGFAFKYRVRPGDPRDQHISLDPHEMKASSFMICSISKALQDAAVYFKASHCSNGTTIRKVNWRQELNLFELFYV
jgi:hypothetical protein